MSEHSPSCIARREALILLTAGYAAHMKYSRVERCQCCGQNWPCDTRDGYEALALPCNCAELVALRRVVEAAKEVYEHENHFPNQRTSNKSHFHRKLGDALAALPTEGGMKPKRRVARPGTKLFKTECKSCGKMLVRFHSQSLLCAACCSAVIRVVNAPSEA